jgi:hypothetical protein
MRSGIKPPPKTRDELVASMAKKLAVPGNRDKKRVNPYVLWISTFAFCFSVLLFLLASHGKKKEAMVALESKQHVMLENPIQKLQTAYSDGFLSVDQYALYLSYLLVNYDSIPVQYKPAVPVVSEAQVYKALSELWLEISPERRELLRIKLPKFNPETD